MKFFPSFGKAKQEVAVVPQKPKLIEVFADRYQVDPIKLLNTLKLTAFKQRNNDPAITDEEVMALLVVANQHKLNPLTKEIYAFPDKKRGGIVPVVSVDGWSRIINENPYLDGIEFTYSPETLPHKGKTCHEWMECSIYRTDRSRPLTVRERFEEVVRDLDFTTPWDTHPNRMHRHKTLIQAARLAFGFAGIYDPDEAERIIEATGGRVSQAMPQDPVDEGLPAYPDERFAEMLPGWVAAIKAGKKSAADMVATIQSKYTLTEEQIGMIRDAEAIEGEVIQAEPDGDRCGKCGTTLTDGACDNCGASQ